MSKRAHADAVDDSGESDEDDFFQPKTMKSSESEHRAQASVAIVSDSAKSRRGESTSKWTLAVRGILIFHFFFFLEHILLHSLCLVSSCR